jgi:polyhydroxyalkanoate synthesis regulator phasin
MAARRFGTSSAPGKNKTIDIMEEFNDILLAGNKSKGERPFFFDDPAVERVLNITMAVVGELAVVRERLDTIERLLAAKGLLKQEEIEAYEPDDSAAEARQRWHAAYIARVLRIIQQELEALAHPESNKPMEEIAEELARI